MVTQATNYLVTTTLYPNQTISDDYDMYKEIAQVVANLPQFAITFQHIKVHQMCNAKANNPWPSRNSSKLTVMSKPPGF